LKEYKFSIKSELIVNGSWVVLNGTLTLGVAKIKGGFLIRNNTIVGWYKAGTKLNDTIKWYDRVVFKDYHKKVMKSTVKRSIRREVENEIYSNQEPEFTREDELIDILEFIDSMRSRKLSASELLLLQDIKVSIDELL
jgi:hypothetical protein